MEIGMVQADCNWPLKKFHMKGPSASERIMSLRHGYIFIGTYSFNIGLYNSISEVIISFYNTFQLCLGQRGLGVRRIVSYFHMLATLADEKFSLMLPLLLYSPSSSPSRESATSPLRKE
ncbi:hypothetical protein HAX54_021342, partial [Datura stramonium]|nr:hypothetical protein [Datura stramonium]